MLPIHPTVHALTEAFPPSDRTDRTVTVEDMEFELRYAPEPGVDLRVRGSEPEGPGGAVVLTAFDCAGDRPLAYPPELPYLPGVKVSVMATPDRAVASATWWMVDDLESAAGEIRTQSEASGWSLSTGPDDGPLPPEMRMIVMDRPGQRRTLFVTSVPGNSTISLFDEAEQAQDG